MIRTDERYRLSRAHFRPFGTQAVPARWVYLATQWPLLTLTLEFTALRASESWMQVLSRSCHLDTHKVPSVSLKLFCTRDLIADLTRCLS
jgi:hypothetical protein